MLTPLLTAALCLTNPDPISPPSTPPTPPNAPGAPAAPAASAADIEAAAIRSDFAALPRSNEPDADWSSAARAVRQRARDFTECFPDDPRGLEMEATLSMGLEDGAGVDDAFGRLLALAPRKTSAGLAWTDYWVSRDPDHAFEVLEDLVKQRPDALLYLDRLFRILSIEAPERIAMRFQSLGDDENSRAQCARELDTLARVAGDMAGVIGEAMRLKYPGHLDIAVATARGHRHANHFSTARRLLDSISQELMTDPAHVYLWSDTYYADHHFDRARELIESIDMDALSKAQRPGLYRRLGFMIPLRQSAADMWPAEQKRRFEDARRNDNPLAVLTINGREVVVELFEDDAPNTVAAFITAADLGIYDGYEAGQVHRGFRTIFGDRHEGDGYPIWSLPKESYQQGIRPVLAGNLVGYSDSKPGSADTRFYILQFPAPHLNERVITYGRVVTGLDVIREMVQGDTLDSVTIIRRREHDYDPDIFDSELKPKKLSELLASPPPRQDSDAPAPKPHS